MEVTVNGVPVHCDVRGSGSPVLMIHGWSPDHRLMTGCMEPVFEALVRPCEADLLRPAGHGPDAGHDKSLLAALTDKERGQFEGLTVQLTERVWRRFRDDVIPGLDLADNDFLENTLGRNVPFSFAIDRADEPYAKPSLILTGRQDCATGYRDIWKVLECYPRASFAVLDKAGHNLQFEQDVLFGALVREWLDRVVAEASATKPSIER